MGSVKGMISDIESLDANENSPMATNMSSMSFLDRSNLKSSPVPPDEDPEMKMMAYIEDIMKNIKSIKQLELLKQVKNKLME